MWNKIIIFIGILALVLFLYGNVGVNAQTTYKLLAPLPEGEAEVPVETGFSIYAAELFRFLLSGAIILALVMLVIGGVEYVGSAGNTSLLGDAKGRILNAILGLLLALSAWLILNLINPDLVDFGLTVPDPAVAACEKAQKECVKCVQDNSSNPSICDASPACIKYGHCIASPPSGGVTPPIPPPPPAPGPLPSPCTAATGRPNECRCESNSQCQSNKCTGTPVAKCSP